MSIFKKSLSFAFLLLVIFLPAFSASAKIATTKVVPVKPIRILIVPGHDNEVWGAEYKNMKEADMTLALGTQIYNSLKKDKRFTVFITRDSTGYTKTFADYFANNMDEIKAFKENAKTQMADQVSEGDFIQKAGTPHHSVSEDVALKLYGISKWANENHIDAMIHIHFDDYDRPTLSTIGPYTGFTVYMPDAQLPNSKLSALLAGNIFKQLSTKYSTSTYPGEAGGLIADQKLIAVGANDTLLPSTRSVLIEYSYIYQKIFRTSTARHKAYTTMAGLTVTGIDNYFFPKK